MLLINYFKTVAAALSDANGEGATKSKNGSKRLGTILQIGLKGRFEFNDVFGVDAPNKRCGQAKEKDFNEEDMYDDDR